EWAVVGDDRDALAGGLGGDALSGAVVVDEEHHAAALRELLVGDRRVLRDIGLRVLDVDLEAGALQSLLQVLAVEVLPAGRRGRVGQDHAGATGLRRRLAAFGSTGGGGAARRTARHQECRAAEQGSSKQSGLLHLSPFTVETARSCDSVRGSHCVDLYVFMFWSHAKKIKRQYMVALSL